MGQGLRGAPHTYTQFTDLVFGPLPKSETQAKMDSIIGTYAEGGFSPFMDDHLGGFKDFDSQFKFLHEKYFPRVRFGPIALSAKKTKVFVKTLELIGFMGSLDGLRPSIRHRDRILNWPTPRNKAELDAFI
jgi:hypothetical protein